MDSFMSLLHNFISLIGQLCASHCSLICFCIFKVSALNCPELLPQSYDYSLLHTCLVCNRLQWKALVFKNLSLYVNHFLKWLLLASESLLEFLLCFQLWFFSDFSKIIKWSQWRHSFWSYLVCPRIFCLFTDNKDITVSRIVTCMFQLNT